MAKTYIVDGVSYNFPDNFDDSAAQTILMKQGIIRPGVPKPGLPPDLQKDPNAWEHPTYGLIGQGVRRMVGGVEAMAQPGVDSKMRGASEIIRGAGTASIPAAIPLAASNIPAAATAIGGGYLGSKLGGEASKYSGASPEGVNLASDVGGVVGGAVGGQIGNSATSRIKALYDAIKDNPQAKAALIDLIPSFGSKINKLRQAIDPTTVPTPKSSIPPPPQRQSDIMKARSQGPPSEFPTNVPPPPQSQSNIMAMRSQGPPPQAQTTPPAQYQSPAMAAKSTMPGPPTKVPPPPQYQSPAMAAQGAPPPTPPNVPPPPQYQSPTMAARSQGPVAKPNVGPPPLRYSMVPPDVPTTTPNPTPAPPPSAAPNIPQNGSVLNTPKNPPQTPPNKMSGLQSAEELKNSLGGEPGKPLVIPGTDTKAAGDINHQVNSTLKGIRENAGVESVDNVGSSLPSEKKAQIRDYLSKSDLHPEVQKRVADKLGVNESKPPDEVTFKDGGAVIPMAKGGVVVPDNPTAAEVPGMARSGEDVIRGTSDIPLSPDGEKMADDLGKQIKKKGGLDTLATTDLKRGVQTADKIGQHTGIKGIEKTPKFRPWHLGGLEGQPTQKVLSKIHQYITKQPNVKVPGMGPKSTSPGESFNTFKRRVIGALKEKLQELKKTPNKKLGVVTHYRDVRLVQAWAAKGFPDSMEINPKFMTEKGNDPPGSMFRLYWRGTKPALTKMDMKSGGVLPGGVYLIRHGLTAWNEENYQKENHEKGSN